MNEETKIVEREPHVSEKKKKEVAELKKLFTDYNTIALVNLIDLPSHQLQVMRKKLGKNSVVKVTKKRLIKKSLEGFSEKKGIEEFIPHLEKVTPALIFSKDNAFKLSSFLRKNKSQVAAKPGQTAPKDLSVSAGPTPFTPGPIIGELASMGVKAAVEEGKIVVKEDAVVVKEGDEISAQIADLLAKLDIKPMEIGLNLVAAYEDGLVIDKETLDFDDSLYLEEIKRIASDAFRLTISIGYITKDNIEILIRKADGEAKALVEKAGIITDDSVKGMVGKANLEAENVKKLVKEPEEQPSSEKNVGEEKPKEKEEKKEEPKKEENLKKDESEENKEETKKMDVDITEKKQDEVPTAEELAEKKKLKEEETKEQEEEKPSEEAPSVHELAEKSKEKSDEVPSINELVEKKEEKKPEEEN